MRFLDSRRAGVLAHPTSLRAESARGDLGPATLRFLDWIHRARFGVWQILPLTPAGAGGSPYSPLSSFAGDTTLISFDSLADAGWFDGTDVAATLAPRPWSTERDRPALRRAWAHFGERADRGTRGDFEAFVEDRTTRAWLEDWSLFIAIRRRLRNLPWTEWDPALARRDPAALRAISMELTDEIAFERWLQFVFARQWARVRHEAHSRGIAILGDLPYYPAHDSADVWSHPALFSLDSSGRPRRIAGVPPDYFSATGQLWGNPTLDWSAHRDEGYAWWIARLAAHLARFDAVRLDHFRGYESAWEVDSGSVTAADGRWVEGPGRDLFDVARARLGDLPCVAEDLGEITGQVRALRRTVGFPGMSVLQFGFSEGQEHHRIDRIEPNCVAYTGTHDNDTTRGWFEALAAEERERVLEQLGAVAGDVVPRMIERLFASAAHVGIVPLQDLLDLGSTARMNRPGSIEGNWDWGLPVSGLSGATADRLAGLISETKRRPSPEG